MITELVEQYCKALESVPHDFTAITRLQRFVLEHALPERTGIVRPRGVRKGRPKECYRNATVLAMQQGYTYCEGLACSEKLGIPVDHAWVIDSAGNVIDATWKDTDKCWYLGVPFSREQLWLGLIDTGTYGLLHKDWQLNVKLIDNYKKEAA